MRKIAITINNADLTKKVKQHLAVIGKRSKTIDGKPMYSDLSTSSAEDSKIWNDLFDSAVETVLASLSALDCYYTSDADAGTITVTFGSQKWEVLEEDELSGLKKALHDSIEKFVWNSAVKEYLDIIHPSTGAKYPPIFARPYMERTEKLLLTIMEIAGSCFVKSDPWKVESPYPTFIEVCGTSLSIEEGEEATVSYAIDIDAKDDIDICPSNNAVSVRKTKSEIVLHGNHVGTCYCTLYSRHDEVGVSKVIKVDVLPATEEHYQTRAFGVPHKDYIR